MIPEKILTIIITIIIRNNASNISLGAVKCYTPSNFSSSPPVSHPPGPVFDLNV